MTDEPKLITIRASEIEEVPVRTDLVRVTDFNEHEVDLMFEGASPGYVITIERDEISDWLDTLIHISRKTWFTVDHARCFARVMMERARYPR